MSEQLSNIIPSAMEFELGGKTYKFAPINIGDLAALGTYRKQNNIKQFREALADMDPALIAAGIEKIIKDDSDINMSSPDAMQFLLHRSMLKFQPDLTIEDAGELLSTVNVQQALTLVNCLGGASKNSDGAQEKKKVSE